MNEELERLIEQGEEILAEKDRNEAIRRIAAEEEAKRREAEINRLFWANLGLVLPGCVVEQLVLSDGHAEIAQGSWPELMLDIDGCPVVMNVTHTYGENVKMNGNRPFGVAGIDAADPGIWEGDLFPGRAEYVFGKHTKCFADLAEALGYARRQARKMVEIQKANDEMALHLGRRLLEEKAVEAQKTPEPVYIPERQADDCVDSIVNKEELYLFIRGVVIEVLDERK